jgi:energy-coupling factor transport system permease protein
MSLVFMTVVFTAREVAEFSILALFTAISVTASRVPIGTVARSVKPVLPIVAFASIINVFMIGGTPIFSVWLFTATYEGLFVAITLSVRILLIIIGGSSMMIFTTTPINLTDGIENLMKPLKRVKVPVHEIAMMMTVALRFIPILIEETDKIIKAQASRGADINEGKFFDRVKSFVPILIPLFVSALRRADDLANAMEARCYRGDYGRTRLRQLKFTRLDLGILAFSLVFFTAFVTVKTLIF